MQKKTIWYIIIAILVVIIIGGIWWFMQPQNGTTNNYSNTQGTNTITNTENTTDATGTSANPSYAQTLKAYAKARIQFNQTCVMFPNDPTYKTGTTVMLDNRSNKNRIVELDNVKYAIGAYDFTLVTLTTTKPLPHTISVDCGPGENQGRILLQK